MTFAGLGVSVLGVLHSIFLFRLCPGGLYRCLGQAVLLTFLVVLICFIANAWHTLIFVDDSHMSFTLFI